MSKSFEINGTDVSNYFTRYGYKVSYQKVTGNNSGFMLDGSYVEDLLTRRPVVELTVMPLNEEDYNELLTLLYPSTYVKLYYFDPYEGDYVEGYFVISDIGGTYRGTGADSNEYWTGMTITFEEAGRSS